MLHNPKKFQNVATYLGKPLLNMVLKYSYLVLMAISGGFLFVLAPSLMSIFSKSPDVINLGVTVLRMVALSEPFFGY